MAKKWIKKEAIKLFDEAVEMSRRSDVLYIGTIAFNQGYPKSIYKTLIDQFEELQEPYELIISNTEAMVFQALFLRTVNERVGLATLEAQHNWNSKSDSSQETGTVKIEGISTEDLNKIIDE